MAAGRVTTGFSKPWVARYNATGNTVSYSGLMELARGVDVSIEPDSADDNKFYANNVEAETASGLFAGGTVTLTVDGLFVAAEKFISGLGDPVNGWTAYGSGVSSPYIGLGFIVRYMSDGVTSYQPFVLPKVKFNTVPTSAATQEDEIDWQTQELTASINRDDTADQAWKYIGDSFATEAEAEVALKEKLGFINPVLSSLTIGSLVLTPAFAANTTVYTANTYNASDAVSAAAGDGVTVAIKANGSTISSDDSVTWTLGENTIEVVASNGTDSTTYTVTVTALAVAELSDITIGSLTLTPTFDADTTSYTTSTTNASDTVSATAATGVTVSIKANGTAIDDGDAVTWETGDNTVEITATNGVDTKVYTVTVSAS